MLWLTSNRGQLLLLMSSLILCPALNITEVGYNSNVNSYAVPGVIISALSQPLRYLARIIESVILMANPSG